MLHSALCANIERKIIHHCCILHWELHNNESSPTIIVVVRNSRQIQRIYIVLDFTDESFQRCIELDMGELTLVAVDFCCFDWKYSAKEFIVFLATDSSPHQSTLTDLRPTPDGLVATSSHSPSKWSNRSLVLAGSSRFRLLCKLRSPEIRGTSLLVSPNCFTRGRRHGGVRSISPSFPGILSSLALSLVASSTFFSRDSNLVDSADSSSLFCLVFLNEANTFPAFVSYLSKLRLLWNVVPFNFLCLIMLDSFSVISLHSLFSATTPFLFSRTSFLFSFSFSSGSFLLPRSPITEVASSSFGFPHAPMAMDLRRSDSLIISSAKIIWLAGSLLGFCVATLSEALLSRPNPKLGTVRNVLWLSRGELSVVSDSVLQMLAQGDGLWHLNDTNSSWSRVDVCCWPSKHCGISIRYGLSGCSRQRSTNSLRLSLVTSSSSTLLVRTRGICTLPVCGFVILAVSSACCWLAGFLASQQWSLHSAADIRLLKDSTASSLRWSRRQFFLFFCLSFFFAISLSLSLSLSRAHMYNFGQFSPESWERLMRFYVDFSAMGANDLTSGDWDGNARGTRATLYKRVCFPLEWNSRSRARLAEQEATCTMHFRFLRSLSAIGIGLEAAGFCRDCSWNAARAIRFFFQKRSWETLRFWFFFFFWSVECNSGVYRLSGVWFEER